MEKIQKKQISPLSKLKTSLQFSSSEKNNENSFLKKKCKCPELLKLINIKIIFYKKQLNFNIKKSL